MYLAAMVLDLYMYYFIYTSQGDTPVPNHIFTLVVLVLELTVRLLRCSCFVIDPFLHLNAIFLISA